MRGGEGKSGGERERTRKRERGSEGFTALVN